MERARFVLLNLVLMVNINEVLLYIFEDLGADKLIDKQELMKGVSVRLEPVVIKGLFWSWSKCGISLYHLCDQIMAL